MDKYYKVDEVEKLLSCGCAYAIRELPTVEVSEDAISREYMLRALNGYGKDWQEDCEIAETIRNAPSVIPQAKEVIYGNEHNCIMTLFGECSYSETGCGDCAVVEKVRDALTKNEQPKEGEWIISADGESSCSVCGASEEEFIYGTENWYGLGESKFCPSCGAKMKGAE